VGERAVGAILRKAQDGKFKSNISRGGLGRPLELNPELEWLSIEATRVLGLEIAGVDILFDGEGYKICEVNSGPGFKGFEQATGLNVPQLVYQYIQSRVNGFQIPRTMVDEIESLDVPELNQTLTNIV
jgi:glutathione synthase/RimK-type ligase-like ATP-grasp enzyme